MLVSLFAALALVSPLQAAKRAVSLTRLNRCELALEAEAKSVVDLLANKKEARQSLAQVKETLESAAQLGSDEIQFLLLAVRPGPSLVATQYSVTKTAQKYELKVPEELWSKIRQTHETLLTVPVAGTAKNLLAFFDAINFDCTASFLSEPAVAIDVQPLEKAEAYQFMSEDLHYALEHARKVTSGHRTAALMHYDTGSFVMAVPAEWAERAYKTVAQDPTRPTGIRELSLTHLLRAWPEQSLAVGKNKHILFVTERRKRLFALMGALTFSRYELEAQEKAPALKTNAFPKASLKTLQELSELGPRRQAGSQEATEEKTSKKGVKAWANERALWLGQRGGAKYLFIPTSRLATNLRSLYREPYGNRNWDFRLSGQLKAAVITEHNQARVVALSAERVLEMGAAQSLTIYQLAADLDEDQVPKEVVAFLESFVKRERLRSITAESLLRAKDRENVVDLVYERGRPRALSDSLDEGGKNEVQLLLLPVPKVDDEDDAATEHWWSKLGGR